LSETRVPKSNDDLKNTIIQAIEKEVMNHPNFNHVTEEEFLYLNSKCWFKFFTMLKQYDHDSRMPIGLFVDPMNETLITVVRKNAISVYNFADISQYTNRAQIDTVRSYLQRNSIDSQNENQASDLLKLVVCVQQLNTSVKILEYSNENDNEYTSSVDREKIQLKNTNENMQLTNKHSIINLTDSLIFNDKK